MAIIRRKLGRNDELAKSATAGPMSPKDLIELAKNFSIRTEPSLDVSALARNLGLSLVFKEMDNNISGYLQKQKGSENWVIAVNKIHHEKRQRFTIAHELGHFFLHQSKSNEFIDETAVLFRNDISNPMEWEANRFAAEILMPEDVFKRKVSEGLRKIEDLADYFKVSALSARVRAKQLGFQGHGI